MHVIFLKPIVSLYGKYRKLMRREFDETLYYKRNKTETIFFVVKRRFDSRINYIMTLWRQKSYCIGYWLIIIIECVYHFLLYFIDDFYVAIRHLLHNRPILQYYTNAFTTRSKAKRKLFSFYIIIQTIIKKILFLLC